MKKANKNKDAQKEAENAPAADAEALQTDAKADSGQTTEAEAAEQESELEKLQLAVHEASEKYLRAKAELENYRKRMQREFTELRHHIKVITVQEFLPVFDHFQMALQHVDDGADGTNLWQGMEMIYAEFKRTFERLGMAAVESVGKPFNPNEHEAMSQEPSDEVEEGHVLREWKTGFRMGEKLLRPATVVVSSGPGEKQPEESAPAK